jgi:hypothetical protein
LSDKFILLQAREQSIRQPSTSIGGILGVGHCFHIPAIPLFQEFISGQPELLHAVHVPVVVQENVPGL